MRKRLASMVALATVLVVPAQVSAQQRDGSPNDPRARDFVRQISVERMQRHMTRLQDIADANEGNRNTFGTGYEASIDYVVRVLERAGYEPEVTPFNFPFWEEPTLPVLNQVTPTPKVYRPGTEAQSNTAEADFISMAYSTTASLDNVAVVPTNDIQIPVSAPGASTSGCEAEDYPAAVRGAVALVQRGTCAFVDKWALAQEAGAVGVIIFNDGANADRQNPTFVNNAIDATIPSVITSFALGQELYNAYQAGQNPTVDFQTSGRLTDRFFNQVIADTPGGDAEETVLLSAHLDSVEEGPGINDNGSGISLLLTMAQRIARLPQDTRHKVRFGFWGGEEEGLVGSQYYAESLTDEEVEDISVVLNYDMIASPNYARLLYDGDGSEETDGEPNPAGPEGSGIVEEVHREWFASKRQPVWAIPFDGRSDYVGFTERGIPGGGLFSGAEDVKTASQERLLGGDAGSWYDPCYHQACDDLTTVLSGVPSLDADGLAVDVEDATDADKAVSAQKMRGGSLRSMRELGAGAAYATWYFSTVRDPFDAGAQRASIARTTASKAATRRAQSGFAYRGHQRLSR